MILMGMNVFVCTGMVKKQVELLNMQDTDANRKRHTTPAGRFFSPIKSGHWPLYRQNDSLSDQQTGDFMSHSR